MPLTLRFIFIVSVLIVSCTNDEPNDYSDDKDTRPVVSDTMVVGKISSVDIDGKMNEEFWKEARWHALNQTWIGTPPDSQDFRGKYKLGWDENYLYLLVSIHDDSLIDIHEDPLDSWWHDDCVEIFLDEDNADDLHQFNHKAFAYHVGLNYDVIDLGPDEKPHFYNDHIQTARTRDGKDHLWEFKISVFDDTYVDDKKDQQPVKLSSGKVMGFALAYCDNDTSAERENFIGSIYVDGEDKDQGWKDAGIFNTLILK